MTGSMVQSHGMTETELTWLCAGIATGILGFLVVWYLRPPQGDKIPVSNDTLLDMKRREGRRGDVVD